MPKALITGISGQDGYYLAELLLEKGYEVHGIVRPPALENPEMELTLLQPLLDRLHLHTVELGSLSGSLRLLKSLAPDECYHLAAESYVSPGFDDLIEMMHSNLYTTHTLLEALHQSVPECRLYFAGSSEMFGNAPYAPQDEKTPFNPRSSYGLSKLSGYHLACYYRLQYGLHISSGILFNHESPRRGRQFVTRKVSSFVAGIKPGGRGKLHLGNLEARRDWGHARDYVLAMWLMLQQDNPDDYIIATGITHSIKDLLETAFSCVGKNYQDYLEVDPVYFREKESVDLVGNSSKAKEKLGWQPRIDFKEMIREMVEADTQLEGLRQKA
ncbi:MAG: GDP-mannose 4,6-dehydratase [Pseudomonadota bacterium]